MISFNDTQIAKLSDLFMDLGKGLLLAGFTLQIFRGSDLLSLIQYIISGILCVYLSLYLTEFKK